MPRALENNLNSCIRDFCLPYLSASDIPYLGNDVTLPQAPGLLIYYSLHIRSFIRICNISN